MPKLDVGVGDEFPAREVRPDPQEEPEVHHHHYYRRRYRQPGRWLFFVLWIMVITFVFRVADMALGGWGWGDWGWGRGHSFTGWRSLEGMLMGILIFGGLIFMGCWRRNEDERDAERRDRDGR
jgi:hypothetical protein